jgi:hypothetical protein
VKNVPLRVSVVHGRESEPVVERDGLLWAVSDHYTVVEIDLQQRAVVASVPVDDGDGGSRPLATGVGRAGEREAAGRGRAAVTDRQCTQARRSCLDALGSPGEADCFVKSGGKGCHRRNAVYGGSAALG